MYTMVLCENIKPCRDVKTTKRSKIQTAQTATKQPLRQTEGKPTSYVRQRKWVYIRVCIVFELQDQGAPQETPFTLHHQPQEPPNWTHAEECLGQPCLFLFTHAPSLPLSPSPSPALCAPLLHLGVSLLLLLLLLLL